MTELPPSAAGPLSADAIRALLENDPPLVSGLEDRTTQLQPNGFDIRLERLWVPTEAGLLGRDDRRLPDRSELSFDAAGWIHLQAGSYIVRIWETVNLPLDLMALGFARSSLLRSGCGIQNAVWDAGYHGRSEALLVVANPHGFRLQRGSRILQLVFFKLAAATFAYRGAFQRENLARESTS